MSHIEIEPAAVPEKSAVARRLFVIAIMQIERPGAHLPEEMVFYPHRPGLAGSRGLLRGNKASVFSFDADDAVHERTIGADRCKTKLPELNRDRLKLRTCVCEILHASRIRKSGRCQIAGHPERSPARGGGGPDVVE